MSTGPFESFLVDGLVTWLAPRIMVGSRYQFKSPDTDNTSRLLRALHQRAGGTLRLADTELRYIVVNNVQLLCVAHGESSDKASVGFNENYISMLRDTVAGQQEPFDGCALIIIHNSLLDTLINTADDLAARGAVWSPGEVRHQLEALVKSQPTPSRVMFCLLDYQAELLQEEGGSMFGFEPLYRALAPGGDLDLCALGLFRDRGIAAMTNAQQIQRRLEENRKLREEIDTVVHHFPEELEERLPYFGEDFIEAHFKNGDDRWRELDVQALWEEIDHQKQRALDFAAATADTCRLIGPRNKSETPAGTREKHLMVLVPADRVAFDLQLRFYGQDLDAQQFRIHHNRGLEEPARLEVRRSRGQRVMTLTGPFNGQPTYLTLRLRRPRNSECYTFHVVLLREGDFYTTAFENQFLVDPKRELLTLQTEEPELRIQSTLLETVTLQQNEQVLDCDTYGTINYQRLYEESDVVAFTVASGAHRLHFNIEGEVSQEVLSLPLLLDPGRFPLLFDDRYNGTFVRAKGKVIIDHKETRIIARRQKLLEMEEEMIEQQLLCLGPECLPARHLQVGAPRLYQAWRELVIYLRRQKTLPSLASWGAEMVERVRHYVEAYVAYLQAIPMQQSLRPEARMVLKLGFATHDGREYFTPLHPLVLAYYLFLVEQIRADESHRSFRNLPAVTRKRLNPKGLVPYVFSAENDFGYTQVVEENPFWLEIVPQQQTNYGFVTKLVREKVEEFIKTFRELFRQVDEAPLILNSVNNGDNREVFLGLLQYFQDDLDESHPVHVNLYDDALSETEFDRYAEMSAYDQIKSTYRLESGKARENAETIIDLLRTRLSFSKFRHADVGSQAYAHVTFFKNNQKIQCVDTNIDHHIAGIACDGLLNGESSRSEHGSYYTAFGLHKVDTGGKPHLELARLLGTLLRPARMPNAIYHEHTAIGLAVSESFQELLNRSYDSSLWTTIIDPKVTLDFFQNTKDLILIHYSDQYTNSASYDAITVTRQTDLYRRMLGQTGDHLLGEFNAFNGEWLLKMVTAPDTIRRERMGILGAWKLVSCLLSGSDITWVPLSVAEMIRVSGNIGLTVSEGDFARDHRDDQFKGRMSDDILFAGFKDQGLYLLPVEVKTGARPDFDKAHEQVRALRRYLVEGLLAPDTLEARLYRGLFVRQILLQVEKYQLYEVFGEAYFQALLQARDALLSGNYSVNVLEAYPLGMVVAHLDSAASFQTQCKVEDDYLQLEIPVSYLDVLISTPWQELRRRLVDDNLLHIDPRYFLRQVIDKRTPVSSPHVPVGEGGAPSPADHTEVSLPSNQSPASLSIQPATDDQPLPTGRVQQSLRIQFGTDIMTGGPVYWEPTNTTTVLNPNTAIIGTMGTGKTQFTKSVVAQLMRYQPHNIGGLPIGVLIFDYKADYVKPDFVQATNAQVYELYRLPFNPLALFGDRPMLPVHTANLFRSTLATAFGLGNKQQNRIRTLVMEAYEQAGIHPQDKGTWGRLAPTLRNVWDLFEVQEKVEVDSLYAALDDLIRFEIFEPSPEKTQSLYDLVDKVTVINLSGYDPQIQNLVVAITLDIFYTQMHHQGSSQVAGNHRQLTKFVLVDEADNFMRQDFPSLKMLMKEGREFGVGTILSTQEMSHFKTGENDYSSYILSWIIHRVAKLKSQDIRAVFSTSSKQEEEQLMNQIAGLDKHHALYVDGEKVTRKIRDLAFWELLSTPALVRSTALELS